MIRPLPAQAEGLEPMSTGQRRLLSAPTLDPLSQWLAEIGESDIPDHEEEARRFGQ